jgi:hypothetical protein
MLALPGEPLAVYAYIILQKNHGPFNVADVHTVVLKLFALC